MIRTQVKKVSGRGRGVFACTPIKKNIIIEKCHLLIIHFSEIGPMLERYVFEFNKNNVALALGNGSLYNHSDVPNAYCEIDPDRLLLTVKSLRYIFEGEEITINYGYSQEEKKKFNIF